MTWITISKMKNRTTPTTLLREISIFFVIWALSWTIGYELDRGPAKKEIPLAQVASRELLLQAQKELNIR